MHHYELQLNRVELQSHTGMHHYELQLNPVELQSHTGMPHYELQLNRVELQSHTGMHHYECIALCKDISMQRGRFCTRSLASCIPRSSEDRSS